MRGEELLQWQRLGACKAFRTRRRDGLTTTAAAAVRLLEGAGAAFLSQQIIGQTVLNVIKLYHMNML